MLKIFFLTLILMALAIAGIAIKMFVFKNGVFTKSCSSIDDGTGKHSGCSCGGGEKATCKNHSKKHFDIKVEPYRPKH